MKVYIKNKMFSLRGHSNILDENQNPLYFVKGKLISPTRKKKIYDNDNNLMYIVRNRYWNFFIDKVFIYDANKTRIATIRKNKWSFNHKYKIEDCVDDMSIDGKFFSRESKILRNGDVIGTITRDFSILDDHFTLEAEQEDLPFLSALVIAFDNLKDKRQNSRT